MNQINDIYFVYLFVFHAKFHSEMCCVFVLFCLQQNFIYALNTCTIMNTKYIFKQTTDIGFICGTQYKRGESALFFFRLLRWNSWLVHFVRCVYISIYLPCIAIEILSEMKFHKVSKPMGYTIWQWIELQRHNKKIMVINTKSK